MGCIRPDGKSSLGRRINSRSLLGYYVAAFEVEGYLPRSELVYVSYAMAGRSVSWFALRDGLSMFLFVFGDDWMTEPAPRRSAAERKAVLLSVFGDAGWECRRSSGRWIASRRFISTA